MKIFILYTGGTIGCVGPILAPLQKTDFINAFKQLVEPTIVGQIPNISIDYDGFDHTLDSTNMQPSDWLLMANKILNVYKEYDAFIVLHGTDTMAYTSSALSFLLPEVSKPIIVTGSQLPLFHQAENNDLSLLYNTDALRNVLGAVKFGTFGMPEVCLYFDDHLYRGNRVVKSNASEFTAFSSPNFPAIGEYGVLAKQYDALFLPQPKNKTIDDWISNMQANMEIIQANIQDASIIPFLIFPAFYDETTGKSFLVSVLQNIMKSDPPVKGIVLEAYGEGNVPSYSQMKGLLTEIHSTGVVIVDCTQVYQGEVNYNAYATGAWLKGCGVISGFDMTSIAAATKLIILKALYPNDSTSALEEKMVKNLSGELLPYYRLSGYQNEFLSPGESLYSINGNFQFINDTSGSLQLKDLVKKEVVWSKDLGQAGRLTMQADCNLVFYNEDYEALYASNTAQIGTNAYFQLEDDGGLCIFDMYTNEQIAKINEAFVEAKA